MNEHDPERIVIEHANGFTMVNTRALEPSTQPYVIPSQCEQVFYLEVIRKSGWSYIVRYNPRGILTKYNALEEEDNVEEEGDAYQGQLVADIDVQDEESDQEDDHPNDVVDNVVVSDDIDDEYITENDIDDGIVDMRDPFNDSDFEPDNDIDFESDEEEYQ